MFLFYLSCSLILTAIYSHVSILFHVVMKMDTTPSVEHDGDGSCEPLRSDVLSVILDATPGHAPPRACTQPHGCLVSKCVYSLNETYRVQAGGARRCARRMPCPPLERTDRCSCTPLAARFPGHDSILVSDYAEKAVLLSDANRRGGRGPVRAAPHGAGHCTPCSLQHSAEMEFSDGHVWAAVQSPLGCSVLAPVPSVSLKAGS